MANYSTMTRERQLSNWKMIGNDKLHDSFSSIPGDVILIDRLLALLIVHYLDSETAIFIYLFFLNFSFSLMYCFCENGSFLFLDFQNIQWERATILGRIYLQLLWTDLKTKNKNSKIILNSFQIIFYLHYSDNFLYIS